MKYKKISGGIRKKSILKKDKKNFPLVSIVMVVLNNKKFLNKSIKSVLGQSYKNFELIIVDGKSTDGTVEILKKIILKLITGYLKKIEEYTMQ